MTTSHIRLPDARAVQLRNLANHRGITMVALVEDMINREIARLDHDNPGAFSWFDCVVQEDGKLFLSVAGVGSFIWETTEAIIFSKAVRKVLDKQATTVDVEAMDVRVLRVGISVMVQCISTNTGRIMTTSVARELADTVEVTARSGFID